MFWLFRLTSQQVVLYIFKSLGGSVSHSAFKGKDNDNHRYTQA
jgi:hypothetical protein